MLRLADGHGSGGTQVVAIGSEDGWLILYDSTTGLSLQNCIGNVPSHGSAVSIKGVLKQLNNHISSIKLYNLWYIAPWFDDHGITLKYFRTCQYFELNNIILLSHEKAPLS